MDAVGSCDVVRVHAAAGLALVRRRDQPDATRWIPWPPETAAAHRHGAIAAMAVDGEDDDGVVDLHHHVADAAASARVPAPSLALQRERFPDARVAFEVVLPTTGDSVPPQNVVVFLHGRGDSHAPFARLGAQMALPQTAVISLRAPLELPFDMGHTWIDDLDADFNVIPPTAHDRKRSDSLLAASDYVRSFLETLRDAYHWPLDRVFLFGFSQGASVAFQVARTLPSRLGGVVLVAGGAVHGPHEAQDPVHDHETPVLLLCGGRDDVFPLSLATHSERVYEDSFKTKAKLLTRHVVANKTHDMIRSGDEMRVVMAFFSTHLYLRNVALENRSDVIEITTSAQPRRR